VIVNGDGVGAVVHGLRGRQAEIESAIFARVGSLASGPVGDGDGEYVAGLRATVAAAVDYVLSGIERGEGWGSVSVPREVAAQAHRAARNGIGLETVMRRYMVGQALLWDFILEEADRVDWSPAHPEGRRVREMLRAQASLLDRLVTDVAREYTGELERASRSRGHLLLERVKALLAGEDGHADGHDGLADDGVEAPDGLSSGLRYELRAEHVGVIAVGAGAQGLLCELADELDRRLLSVVCGQETVWGWLGGQRALEMADLKAVISRQEKRGAGTREPQLGVQGSSGGRAAEVCVAAGEPAWGVEGWRVTHRQAQAALLVAEHGAPMLTRYRDVALLAAALKDPALARALTDIYIGPLQDSRDGGAVLRETLRAYLDAQCNVSCAASTLNAARSTVLKRLRAVEARLGCTLNPCPAELEIALALDELGGRE
jgi:PucR C-terminal helix-turn-helix domain